MHSVHIITVCPISRTTGEFAYDLKTSINRPTKFTHITQSDQSSGFELRELFRIWTALAPPAYSKSAILCVPNIIILFFWTRILCPLSLAAPGGHHVCPPLALQFC